ncbi:GL16388 [Drosophila persimilis]|uniref:GL16388 n=1 Tax=Drosophila persimilis TaxID=7234 RepID=B4GWQ7_DROPE|nr:GL16388 [Drosophila persimilis]
MAISSAATASYLLMALTHDSHSHSLSPSDGSGSGGAGDSEDSQTGGRRRRPPRQKINARERYRTFNVNAAYEALRSMIPTEPNKSQALEDRDHPPGQQLHQPSEQHTADRNRFSALSAT